MRIPATIRGVLFGRWWVGAVLVAMSLGAGGCFWHHHHDDDDDHGRDHYHDREYHEHDHEYHDRD